jgi:hypothetical protein
MEDSKLIAYTHDSEIINISGNVESDCNAITFINIGTDTVNVLGYPLLQGFQLYLPGNVGEVDKTNYSVRFLNGAGTTQQLLVIRKRY